MLSYNNDPELKAIHVAQAKHHYEADMLLSGTYGRMDDKEFHGCSIGCFAFEIDPRRAMNQEGLHRLVAENRHLPLWLMYLQDRIFEGLPKGERGKWHMQLAEAVPVGVDLEPVRHLLNMRRMKRLVVLLNGRKGKHGEKVDVVIEGSIAAIEEVHNASEVASTGGKPDWKAVREKSWSARRAAAAAADAAADAAAYAAAADAAAYAADAADAAAYTYAARTKSYQAERDDLLDILKSMTA